MRIEVQFLCLPRETLQVFFDLMRAIAARKAQENQGDGSERKKKRNCCVLL